MKRLFVSILTTGILSLSLLLAPMSAVAATGSWQRSVAIQSRWSTDFASQSFYQSVDKALSTGVNTIVLVTPLYQSNIYSTDVQTSDKTPTDAALTSGVRYVQSKGAKAVISVHLNPGDGQWRAMINPGDRSSWFNNYGANVVRLARVAQSSGASQMVLGTELSHMAGNDYNTSNGSYWNTLISNVRAVYRGSLTYSAQHNGYMSDLPSIRFWDKLDYIGVSAYYGMGTDTSVAAITNKWAEVDRTYIRPIATQYGKKVLFTEVGYQSKTGALRDPGSAYQLSGSYDPALQANAYKGMFNYWSNVSYFSGVTLWDWSSDPNAGGSGNVDYTPQAKPAEGVMKEYFLNNVGSGDGGSPTTPNGPTTPTTPPPSAPTTYSMTANASSAKVGTPVTANVAVSGNGTLNSAIVDIEIYDAQNNRVAQKFADNQTVTANPANYSVTWTPTTSGTYTIRGGVFNSNWSTNYVWNNDIAKVTATAATPPPTPPTPPTTPTTPPPVPPTTPTNPPTTPPTTTNLSIWWPSNGAAVSGVQPFKAALDGVDVNSYQMFWQVDGGTMNRMETNNIDGPHKEAAVDLTPWTWQPSRNYNVNFVAKDATGNVITQKSTIIRVN